MQIEMENDPIFLFDKLTNFLFYGKNSLTKLITKYCLEGCGSK